MKIMKIIKSGQIESRLMRSMRNDLTKTAQAAREPEMVQNKVFKAPQGVLLPVSTPVVRKYLYVNPKLL